LDGYAPRFSSSASQQLQRLTRLRHRRLGSPGRMAAMRKPPSTLRAATAAIPRALLRGARPGAEGEICGDELGGRSGGSFHDAANYRALTQHVVIIFVPLAGGPTGRGAAAAGAAEHRLDDE